MKEGWTNAAGVLGVSIGTAVLYGVCHDQVTARVCVEYFTVGYPRVIASESPTALAFVWGVLATWWVGVLLGFPLALAATVGGLPRVTPRDLLRPVAVLLGVMAVCALLAGVVGYTAALRGGVWLMPPLADEVPAARHARFLADLWAHNASYLTGFVGGNVLLGWVWRQRRLRQMREQQAVAIPQ
jgi:hypothetical protein